MWFTVVKILVCSYKNSSALEVWNGTIHLAAQLLQYSAVGLGRHMFGQAIQGVFEEQKKNSI